MELPRPHGPKTLIKCILKSRNGIFLHRAPIGQNLVFLRGFSENSFTSLINRARARRRARMAQLGLLRSRGPGIVQDRSA